MGIQFAREPKQPGETLRYSMEFKPGANEALAEGDALTGEPSIIVRMRSDNSVVTSSMIYGSATRSGNIVYFYLMSGTDGESYKVSITCDTVNGENDVQEDLVIFVKEL